MDVEQPWPELMEDGPPRRFGRRPCGFRAPAPHRLPPRPDPGLRRLILGVAPAGSWDDTLAETGMGGIPRSGVLLKWPKLLASRSGPEVT